MATTLAELELKFKSEIAAKTDKDAAALQRVDAQIQRAQASLAGLEKAARSASLARIAADKKVEAQAGIVAGVDQQLAAARARVQELSSSGTPPAMLVKAKQDAADLAGKLDTAKLKLDELKKASEAASGKQGASEDAVKARQKEIDAIKAARPELEDLAKQAANAGKEEEKTTSSSIEMAAAWAKVSEVALKVAKAVALAALSVVAFAFNAASAARSLRILGAALTGSDALGAEFVAIVNQLSREVPLAKDQITELAREMSLLKLGRRDLQAGLTAVAIVTSALGDAAGGAVKSIIAANAATKRFSLGARDMFGEFTALAGTGLKSSDVIAALAKQMNASVPAVEQALRLGQIKLADGLKALEAVARARFGKTIAAQMLDVNVQLDKAKEALASLFDGVDLEPVLSSLRDFLTILDTSTVTGRTLKALLGTVLGAFGASLQRFGPLAKVVFQGMIIAALKLYIALKPIVGVIGGIASAIGRAVDAVSEFLGVNLALKAGQFIFAAIAATVGLLAAAIFIATIPLLVLGAAIVLVGYLMYEVVNGIIDAWNAAAEFFASIDLAQAGADLIASLVSGIVSNAGAVLAAMGNLATSAVGAFKDKLLMRSPSKVLVSAGKTMSESTAMGVDAGAPALTGAMEDMAGGAASAASKPAGGTGGANGGGARQVNITMGDVYFSGQKASGEEKQSLRDWLIEELTIADGAIGAGAT